MGGAKRYATFDRTGRLLFLTTLGGAVRRGLDHRMVESKDGADGRVFRELGAAEKWELVDGVRRAVLRYRDAHPRDLGERERAWLVRIAAWTPAKLEQDEADFHRVYKPISILPPDQYRSLVVQVTEGCSYNRCLFCDFYRDRPFHIKSEHELTSHVAGLREWFGERMADRSGVFLGDGNALTVPTDRLLRMIAHLRAALPASLFAGGIATFMDTFSLERKSEWELSAVCAAGLDTVYVGFETGADDLRRFLRKQGTAQEALAAMTALKQAGFRLGVIVLVGAGGVRYASAHAKATKDALATLPLTRGDLIYLSPFVEPRQTHYREALAAAGIEALSPQALRAQYETLRANLVAHHPDVKVTLYSLGQHLY